MELVDRIPGFGLPMASAVLMAWFPDRFTFADGRALRTFEQDSNFPGSHVTFQKRDWEPYLVRCRELLAECRASDVSTPGQGRMDTVRD
jgi:hypothetical protein